MQHRALVVDRVHGRPMHTIRGVDDAFLGEGDLILDVRYSSLNYKDALALRASKGVARILPLIPGIDAVGTVIEDRSGRLSRGQTVVVNGAGLGETRHGGYSDRLVTDAASAVAVPDPLTAFDAAAIGTAGYTAALCALALFDEGIREDSGEVLVTGATGGVGSIAVRLLSGLGYRVAAETGRADTLSHYLRNLGAVDIVTLDELNQDDGKPLRSARWAGVIDTVGSRTLASALASTRWGGVVAACGLAQGTDLPTTVLPFILRAVRLVGVDSVSAPLELRQRAWGFLAANLDLDALDTMTTVIHLDDVPAAAKDLLDGRRHGRTVVVLA